MSDPIAALATGRQLSAIGIVRLSGPGVIDAVSALFRPADGRALSEHAPRSLVYGRLLDREGRLLDLCLSTYSRAPHSYTGEDTAELQCHGSPMLLRLLLDELFALGCRAAEPGEFTKRAFLNGRLALSSAEAVADLIDAESAEAVHNAAGQLHGAMAARIERIYAALTDISAHFHAVLDYPDEEIEDFQIAAYEGELQSALAELERLLASYARGRQMKAGIPTAIIGLPNAGKSSLLNALLGYERAIVTDRPGTTRDTIEERLSLGGLSLRLTDTAGLRETDDAVERLGVERSRRALLSAGLVLAVVDGSVPEQDGERALLAAAEAAPKAVAVLSKADLPGGRATLETSLPTVRVSALRGEGLEELERTVGALFPLPEVPAGEILTNARQADAISRAAESLRAALEALRLGLTPDLVLTEAETAMQALGELNGRSLREDVTQRIFSRFCVGK